MRTNPARARPARACLRERAKEGALAMSQAYRLFAPTPQLYLPTTNCLYRWFGGLTVAG